MNFTGSKYDRNLTTKQIAERIRAEIKVAVKAGELPAAKYSVRLERSRTCTSINVTISALPFPIVNRDYIVAVIDRDLSRYPETHTAEAQAVIASIEEMVKAYNYDHGDLQTDYFNVRFYDSVRFDANYEQAEREAMKAVIRAERAAEAARLEALRAAGDRVAAVIEAERVRYLPGWPGNPVSRPVVERPANAPAAVEAPAPRVDVAPLEEPEVTRFTFLEID